jgi:hypothetical protein
MQFAGFPILCESETPTHITDGTIVTFIAETLSSNLSVRSRVFPNFVLGAINHSLRYWNPRHHGNSFGATNFDPRRTTRAGLTPSRDECPVFGRY